MIVFHAGLPRSGTVLVGAILRRLFAFEGVDCQQHNPHGDALIALWNDLERQDAASEPVHLIHTHTWHSEMASRLAHGPASKVTGFLCVRDPRDVCVSLMGLHDHAFEQAAELTLAFLHHFHWMHKETAWPILKYASLAHDKPGQISAIAAHLGVNVDAAQIKDIDQATSVARHRAIMEQVRDGTVARLVERHNHNRILREDAETLINDRHIQSGKIGRWKDELSIEDQTRLTEVLSDYSEWFNP